MLRESILLKCTPVTESYLHSVFSACADSCPPIIWTHYRLFGNLFMAKCWFNELWARETKHQKPGRGIKWLQMRVLHPSENNKKKPKEPGQIFICHVLKDSFSSQTWSSRCKTNVLTATTHVTSSLCSGWQGKKTKPVWIIVFQGCCFPCRYLQVIF